MTVMIVFSRCSCIGGRERERERERERKKRERKRDGEGDIWKQFKYCE